MSETRKLLDAITKIYTERFEALQLKIEEQGLTKDSVSELKIITAHCLNVEKLLIDEASKLSSALPEFKLKLLNQKVTPNE
jgi:hypothetical protein